MASEEMSFENADDGQTIDNDYTISSPMRRRLSCSNNIY